MKTNRATLALVLLLAACQSAASTGSAASTDPSTGSAPSTDPGPGSLAPSPSASSTRCHTGDLKVTVQAAPGGGAAGSVYEWLVFTNASPAMCTMYGFPGVSWVTGSNGAQVNDPAARMTGVDPARVTLPAGRSAHATLQSPHPMEFPDTCVPVEVPGLRVYPPDETEAVFVPGQRQVCSTKGIGLARVGPVNTSAE